MMITIFINESVSEYVNARVLSITVGRADGARGRSPRRNRRERSDSERVGLLGRAERDSRMQRSLLRAGRSQIRVSSEFDFCRLLSILEGEHLSRGLFLKIPGCLDTLISILKRNIFLIENLSVDEVE